MLNAIQKPCHIALLAMLLAACNSGEKPAEQPKSPLDPQLQALHKAEQAQKLIQESEAKRREKIDGQGL